MSLSPTVLEAFSCPLAEREGSPTVTWTVRTCPSLLMLAWEPRTSCHQFLGRESSFTITISPIARFFRGLFQLLLCCRLARYSFLQQHQNSFLKCWTLLHRFLEFRSADWNMPSGGSTTVVFKVRRLLGVGESGKSGSLRVFTVNGQLFTIASASHRNVWRDSSSNWEPFLT